MPYQGFCMKFAKIPLATINRLSVYSRTLRGLAEDNVDVISSERLAKLCAVNPAQIRKDLAYFGEFGVRGVGYRVSDLVHEIKEILGLNRMWNLGLVGVGNLGSALIRHTNFIKQGYRFRAAFDVDPEKVNKKLPNGLIIHHFDDMESVIKEKVVEIGLTGDEKAMLKKSADAVQSVVDFVKKSSG